MRLMSSQHSHPVPVARWRSWPLIAPSLALALCALGFATSSKADDRDPAKLVAWSVDKSGKLNMYDTIPVIGEFKKCSKFQSPCRSQGDSIPVAAVGSDETWIVKHTRDKKAVNGFIVYGADKSQDDVVIAEGWKRKHDDSDPSTTAVIPEVPPNSEGCWVSAPCKPDNPGQE